MFVVATLRRHAFCSGYLMATTTTEITPQQINHKIENLSTYRPRQEAPKTREMVDVRVAFAKRATPPKMERHEYKCASRSVLAR